MMANDSSESEQGEEKEVQGVKFEEDKDKDEWGARNSSRTTEEQDDQEDDVNLGDDDKMNHGSGEKLDGLRDDENEEYKPLFPGDGEPLKYSDEDGNELEKLFKGEAKQSYLAIPVNLDEADMVICEARENMSIGEWMEENLPYSRRPKEDQKDLDVRVLHPDVMAS